MRSIRILALSACVLGLLSACASPGGTSPAEKRASTRTMRSAALAKLYAAAPSTRQVVESSAGYAVFSNMGTKIFVVASGNGYGVAVDNSSGQETFMRMIELGGGVGFGVKDIRQILAFRTRAAFESFLTTGLEVGGDADAGLKTRDHGGLSASASQNVGSLLVGDVQIYQLTERGASVSATVTAARYYRDKKLE